MKKTKILFYCILCLTIINVSKKIVSIKKTEQKINYITQKKTDLEQKNKKLTQKKEYYSKDEFIKHEAKEKLELFEPNEVAVILPKFPDLSSLEEKGKKINNLPNYKQWWKIFFAN